VSLRERKKQRTRRELADTALRLFLDQGFDAVTLDHLVDTVEVSKRTFFRVFPSKEAVALAAETELWDAYVARVARTDISGPILTALREVLSDTVMAMGDDWDRRYVATRGLASRTPALRDYSDLTSIAVQRRLVEVLEDQLGWDSLDDVRLVLLGELAMSAWRCASRNWVRGLRDTRGTGLPDLVREVRDAFDAIPSTLALSAP
jgi:AcrR family transcriptional regulator